MPDPRPTLSVVVMVRDAEDDIAACLAGAAEADELIVVDTGSVDATRERAAAAGARVVELAWRGFGPTRTAAFALAGGEWIFWLDADERITPELWASITAAVTADGEETGWLVRRRANFLGRWMRGGGWGRDRVLRLFRRDAYRVVEKQVHESVAVSGHLGILAGELQHFTDPTLDRYLEKFSRYTTLAARDLQAAGRRARLVDLLLRPPWTFVRMYLLRGGFIDGIPGLILAGLSAAYVFVKYARLRELGRIGNGQDHAG